MKTTTREFEFVGGNKAYVVEHDGRPVGTITQYSRTSAWIVTRGVGLDGVQVDTAKTKKEAIALLAK